MNENGRGPGIGKAILEVMGNVGYVQKENKSSLPYSFVGEAALIAALRPSMLEHGIICYVLELTDIERSGYVTAKGTAMNTTNVHGIVRFEHPESESYRDVHAIGEGADPGDKAGNKAATGMLKYALRQTFLIETGDDPDATSSEGQERMTPSRVHDYDPSPNKEASFWPPAFVKELKAQGIVKQKNHATALLNLSPFDENSELQEVMRWAVIYRARREDGLKTKEAAEIATSEYEASK